MNNTRGRMTAASQGLISYIVFMLLIQPTRLFTSYWTGSGWADNDKALIPIVYLSCTVASIYAYYHITLATSRYSKEYTAEEKNLPLVKYLLTVTRKSLFWFEVLPKLFLLLILPSGLCFFTAARFITFFLPATDSILVDIAVKLIAAAVIIIADALIKKRLYPIKEKRFGVAASRFITAIAGYFGMSIGLTLILYVLHCLIKTLISPGGIKNIIVLLSPIVLFIAVYQGIYLLRALIIRAKFLKKLKRCCKNTGAELSEIYRPYASVFRLGTQQSFTLIYQGKYYECQLLSSLHKGDPVYVSPDGEMFVKHIIMPKILRTGAFSRHLPHYFTSLNFGWDANNDQAKKVLIFSPVPSTIFAGTPTRSALTDIGGKIGGYTVYNGTGFINAIERDCLCTDKR